MNTGNLWCSQHHRDTIQETANMALVTETALLCNTTCSFNFPQSKDLCRDLIKRAKAWRDHTWPRGSGGTGRPSSYLVSLLVAKAFENSQKKMGVFSTMNPDTLALRRVASCYIHTYMYIIIYMSIILYMYICIYNMYIRMWILL